MLMGHPVPASFMAPNNYKYYQRDHEKVNTYRRYGYVGTFYPQKSDNLLATQSYSITVLNQNHIGQEFQKSSEQMAWRSRLAKIVQVSTKIALHQIMMASMTEYYHEREPGLS